MRFGSARAVTFSELYLNEAVKVIGAIDPDPWWNDGSSGCSRCARGESDYSFWVSADPPVTLLMRSTDNVSELRRFG